MSRVVIKAGHFDVPSNGRYSLELRDIAQQAAGILDDARMQSQRILQDAESTLESDRQTTLTKARLQGFEKGLVEGKEAGYSAALTEARRQFSDEHGELTRTLTHLLDEFTNARERLYLEARRDVIVLAIAIASRMINQLNQIDEIATSTAAQSCQEALEVIGEASEVLVRVHPEDKVVVERFCTELAEGVNASRHIRWADDPSMGRGGVEVETANTRVDGSITSRIAKVADELVAGWQARAKELGMAGSP